MELHEIPSVAIAEDSSLNEELTDSGGLVGSFTANENCKCLLNVASGSFEGLGGHCSFITPLHIRDYVS